MKRILTILALACVMCSCSNKGKVLHVYSVFVPEEEAVLRTYCEEFSADELKSRKFRKLAQDMITTVTDPSQDGVGIAAPQVGVSKRLIVVCRLDKEGEPFEAYANPQIDSCFGGIEVGPEGCLSIPGYRGNVPRSKSIVLTYTDVETGLPVTEVVDDYTARIFQHEIDHTNGILYTDRTEDVFPDEETSEEE